MKNNALKKEEKTNAGEKYNRSRNCKMNLRLMLSTVNCRPK